MSDRVLRDLERRWKQTGRVEDEAAFLRERLRVGDLTQGRLELAAYCGHEAARITLGPTECPHGLTTWAGRICEWGKPAAVAAAGVCAEKGLEAWQTLYPDDQRPHRFLAAALDWAQCPCTSHVEQIHGVGNPNDILDPRAESGAVLQLAIVLAAPARIVLAHGGEAGLLSQAVVAAVAGTGTSGSELRALIARALIDRALSRTSSAVTHE